MPQAHHLPLPSLQVLNQQGATETLALPLHPGAAAVQPPLQMFSSLRGKEMQDKGYVLVKYVAMLKKFKKGEEQELFYSVGIDFTGSLKPRMFPFNYFHKLRRKPE